MAGNRKRTSVARQGVGVPKQRPQQRTKQHRIDTLPPPSFPPPALIRVVTDSGEQILDVSTHRVYRYLVSATTELQKREFRFQAKTNPNVLLGELNFSHV